MYFPFAVSENNPCSSVLRNTQELCLAAVALGNQVYMTYALALKYLHLTGEPKGESDLWPT